MPHTPQLEEHRHGLRRQAEAGGSHGRIGDGKDEVLEQSGLSRPRIAEDDGTTKAMLPGKRHSLVEWYLAVLSRFEGRISERSPFLVLALHRMVDHPRPQWHIDAFQPDRQPYPRGEADEGKVTVGGSQPFQVVDQIRIRMGHECGLGRLLGDLPGLSRRGFLRLGPPQRLDELAALLAEPWRREPGLAAQRYHVEDSTPRLLYIPGEEHRLRQKRVMWDGGVGPRELLEAESGGKPAGVPYLEPVGEEYHLHAGVARVVAVGDGVDNCFGDRLTRN